MKKLAVCLLMIVMLVSCALAETIVFSGVEIDLDAAMIDFGKTKVTDVDGLRDLIARMPNLKEVRMYASKLTEEEMDLLFYGFPDVFFGWTLRVGDHTVRTDQTAFSTLHTSSPKPAHKTQSFIKLKYCTKMLALDFGHNHVDDISFLAEMPQLRVLIIGQNRVSNISVLALLKDLEYLELFSNRITNWWPLVGLTKLKDLNIKYNPGTDITPIMQMTWLERFWAGYDKWLIPGHQRKEMEAAVPDCEYNWTGHPTSGTWRKHPRYFVIKEMFRTGKYIPFEE